MAVRRTREQKERTKLRRETEHLTWQGPTLEQKAKKVAKSESTGTSTHSLMIESTHWLRQDLLRTFGAVVVASLILATVWWML